MKKRTLTSKNIEKLVSFLPRLYAEGFVPIRGWDGGTRREDEAITIPWPEYEPIVEKFFKVASSEFWSDYEYDPEEAGRMLHDERTVKTATLEQIKTMLTYCVRGERFCDGHWGAMIEGGHVRRLLERLAAIGSENA